MGEQLRLDVPAPLIRAYGTGNSWTVEIGWIASDGMFQPVVGVIYDNGDDEGPKVVGWDGNGDFVWGSPSFLVTDVPDAAELLDYLRAFIIKPSTPVKELCGEPMPKGTVKVGDLRDGWYVMTPSDEGVQSSSCYETRDDIRLHLVRLDGVRCFDIDRIVCLAGGRVTSTEPYPSDWGVTTQPDPNSTRSTS